MGILRPQGPRGFTLIEVVVVLLIFGVIISMAAAITRGISAAQKRTITSTRMATVDAALVQFVSQQRRLPCPADGTLASSAVTAGVEVCPSGTMQNGVVPWRTLAITESDATDGWMRRLTYRTDPGLTVAGPPAGMDMSFCDPAGQEPVAAPPKACNLACTAAALASCTLPSVFLNSRGLKVKNVAGTVLMDPAAVPYTGAAYVVISHGESGGGGYLNTGVLGSSTIGDGAEEMKNYASLAYVSAAVTYYVDDSISDAAGNTHFDDIVSRPSIMSVATKAGLGPRSH